MIFEALPELDGIELCNDDISGFWDRYAAYDVVRETPECEWSYPKRFRTFVQKVHEVVSGEFGKTYFHFTWGLRADEQHVQPAVFESIFTDAVPTENLYLMPKITMADRWWHQPYNTTFNRTPHDTVVLFETMNYYESGRANLFPTYSGQYFQNGLKTILAPESSNVRGMAMLAGMATDRWDTTGAYAYVLYRLAWDPYEDIEAITRDFCAIHFGPEAADAMAQIYLMTPSAYKYGLHIEPVSYGQFNSFIHMRVGTFPVEGYPTIDGGREHLEFLRRIYLRCKPWERETFDDLNHGLAQANDMVLAFQAAKPLIQDPELARTLEERVNMTRLLIATNNAYVRTAFALFDYFDRSSTPNRLALEAAYTNLVETRAAFMRAPGFGYQLFGVDQVMRNAAAAIEDVDAAREALDSAPSRSELEASVARLQAQYRKVLEERAGDAVHFGRFELMVDGRDILVIRGDSVEIEHLRWDYPEVAVQEILVPLPQEAVTVIPNDLYSRPIHPFVLEQPAAENGYTTRIYLDDLPGGKDWVKFDLYFVRESPEALGLDAPW